MSKYVGIVLLGVLVVVGVQAQDQKPKDEDVVKELTVGDLEKILKEALKQDSITRTEYNSSYHYQLSKDFSMDYFHGKNKNDPRKFLLIQFQWPKDVFKNEITFQKLNDWNIAAVYSRAYLHKGKNNEYTGVTLEGTLPLDAGVSSRQLGAYAQQFDSESARFRTFVGGLKEAKPQEK